MRFGNPRRWKIGFANALRMRDDLWHRVDLLLDTFHPNECQIGFKPAGLPWRGLP